MDQIKRQFEFFSGLGVTRFNVRPGQFEKVELTSSGTTGTSQPQSDMVLEGHLVSTNPPRYVSNPTWR